MYWTEQSNSLSGQLPNKLCYVRCCTHWIGRILCDLSVSAYIYWRDKCEHVRQQYPLYNHLRFIGCKCQFIWTGPTDFSQKIYMETDSTFNATRTAWAVMYTQGCHLSVASKAPLTLQCRCESDDAAHSLLTSYTQRGSYLPQTCSFTNVRSFFLSHTHNDPYFKHATHCP